MRIDFCLSFPLGDFKSTSNFNHGHAENGGSISIGYFGGLKKDDFSLAIGGKIGFIGFSRNDQTKLQFIEESLGSQHFITPSNDRSFTNGFIAKGKFGFTKRLGKHKHGLLAVSGDIGGYRMKPAGITFTATKGFNSFTESISPDPSFGLVSGLTTDYVIFLDELFGFTFGIEYNVGLTQIKNTGYRLHYWIPKIGFVF